MTTSPHLTVRDLRRRWKPAKDRLAAVRADHPTNVRFHRACSWLQRVEDTPPDDNLDLVLTCQWIGFNALYGQWDPQGREPRPDRECWRRFLDRLLQLDESGRIAGVLVEHKRLVLTILDDAYLASFFWRDPSTDRATKTTREKRNALTWYVEQRWGRILEAVVEHIYLLRCQLVHGAATYGSQLNRASLRHCTTMLGHLLQACLCVYVEHGSDHDWGPMCYPPLA